jgi:hypothetical protein
MKKIKGEDDEEERIRERSTLSKRVIRIYNNIDINNEVLNRENLKRMRHGEGNGKDKR